MEEKIFVVLVNRCYRSLDSLSDAFMKFSEYVMDESGVPVGVRLQYCESQEDWPDMSGEVILYPYKKFYFECRYIDISGPTDWNNDYISINVSLIPYADIPNEIWQKVDAAGYCYI